MCVVRTTTSEIVHLVQIWIALLLALFALISRIIRMFANIGCAVAQHAGHMCFNRTDRREEELTKTRRSINLIKCNVCWRTVPSFRCAMFSVFCFRLLFPAFIYLLSFALIMWAVSTEHICSRAARKYFPILRPSVCDFLLPLFFRRGCLREFCFWKYLHSPESERMPLIFCIVFHSGKSMARCPVETIKVNNIHFRKVDLHDGCHSRLLAHINREGFAWGGRGMSPMHFEQIDMLFNLSNLWMLWLHWPRQSGFTPSVWIMSPEIIWIVVVSLSGVITTRTQHRSAPIL